MISLWSILSLTHFVGLALGVGAATVKMVLLYRCRSNHELVPAYIRLRKSVTRLIVIGLILLTLSGVGWLLLGFPFTTLLITKITLVSAVWVIGPIIDNAIEPRFDRLAPLQSEPVSPDFVKIQRRYLTLEIAATALFYATIVVGVLL